MASPLASRRALRVHLAAAVVVPACLALTWWQATRAADGNTLSWAYTFEWPLFAGYAVYMWWRLLHDPDTDDSTSASTLGGGALPDPLPTGTRMSGPQDVDVPGGDDGPGHEVDEDELAAYNRYLAALNASGRHKHW